MQHQHQLWLKLYLTWKEYSFTFLYVFFSLVNGITAILPLCWIAVLDEILTLISVFNCLHAIISFACVFKQVIFLHAGIIIKRRWAESVKGWVVFTSMWLIWTHFLGRRARMTSQQMAWGPLRTQTPHDTLIWWVMKTPTSYKEMRRDEERSRKASEK